MEEIWKPINGYEGIYEVSSFSNVRSLDRIIKVKFGRSVNYTDQKLKGRILKQNHTTYGYAYVALAKNGKSKTTLVHRLVANAFIDNPENLPCVNHKDENQRNNNVSNLEWCSYEYNNTYKDIHLRRKKTNRKIIQYDLDMNEIKRWESITDAANYYNIENSNISACCVGKRNHCAGFKWRYYE